MRNTENIERMEAILNETKDLIADMQTLSDRIDTNLSEYRSLMEYFTSDERMKDLEDDEKGLFPDTLRRGVLDEDSIWGMSEDYRSAALDMMETCIKILKNN